ncbi:MAG: hypothetical protein ACI8TQ_002558 [Planctomycetota bacterium]|jgi:hypothetical protein
MASMISIIATLALFAPVQDMAMPVVLPLRERAEVQNRWLAERLDAIVPALMREAGVDCWVLVAREYNEDPVVKTMLPATWLAARRRTILVFFDSGEDQEFERLAVARYDIGEAFPRAWDPEQQPDQWACLAELIEQRAPKRIAVNVSHDFALADGLSHGEHEGLMSALSEEQRAKIVPGEALAIGWLETRVPSEMVVYPALCRIAHAIIAEGLSESVIQPGVTTSKDVQWWYRERIAELKLDTWFHPSVEIQRAAAPERGGSFADKQGDLVIQPGDFLHVDFGITYLGLNTDTQQHAYVLKAGETEAPLGLRQGFAKANRLQDILMSQFKVDRSGNQVLKNSREIAIGEGLRPSIYTHPLGFHGHGAGATIGMWDQQGGVPGKGDYPVRPNTAWSIELNVTEAVAEWGGKEVRFMLEEDAFFDGESCEFIDGRQTELWLIPRPITASK